MYSLLWWSTRALILQFLIARLTQSGLLRLVVPIFSGAIVAIPAVLIPYLSNVQAQGAALRLRASDLEPGGPIVLPETVALIIDGNYNWLRRSRFAKRFAFGFSLTQWSLA